MVSTVTGAAATDAAAEAFWANDLEFDSARVAHLVSSDEMMHGWIDKLSGHKARMLCRFLGLNHED